MLASHNNDFSYHENLDYIFFDIIKEHKSDFLRLTEVKIYFDNELRIIDRKLYQKIFGNAFAHSLDPTSQNKGIEVQIQKIKGFQFSFLLRTEDRVI